MRTMEDLMAIKPPNLADFPVFDDWLVAWHGWRRSGFGGSDSSIMCNLAPPDWGSPISIILDKQGRGVPRESSIAMRRGTFLEPFIAREFTDETGIELAGEQVLCRSARYPWMIASIDRVTADGRIVQLKDTNGRRVRLDDSPDSLPQYWKVQAQHEMEAYGTDVNIFVVMVGGEELKIYYVERDQDMIDNLAEILGHYWVIVESGDLPEEIQPYDAKIFRHLFGEQPGYVELSGLDAAAATTFVEAKHQLDAWKHEKDKAEARLLLSLGDLKTGYLPDGRTVTRSVSPIPACTSQRKAHTRTVVYVKEARR
jgi:putative phage-type endonuclease